nr:copia LTR rider [Tanacetum cinerariifolium]
MNRNLLERTLCLLLIAEVNRSFWAKALSTACYLTNRSPATAIYCKTPIEVWSGNPVDYLKVCVFGFPAYYHVSEGKLDPRGEKGIFIRYGYQKFSPSERRVILSRDVTFDEDYLFRVKQDPIESKLEYGVSKKLEDVPKQDYVVYTLQVVEEVESLEPDTYREAITSKDSDMWITAMGEEIESLHKNKTWELVQLLERRKVVVHHELELEQLDVKIVFLHGELKEEIYMSQPEGFVVQVKEDYVYLGAARKILVMEIIRDRKHGKLFLSPKSYIEKIISCFGMNLAKSVNTPSSDNFCLSTTFAPQSEAEIEYTSRIPYASVVGSLMYVMVCTRPDVAHAMSVASRYMAHPEKEHWNAVKHIFRYLKGTSDVGLIYGGEHEYLVVGYSDSDYAVDLDARRSLTCYVFTIRNSVVSWKPTLQPSVALSTTEVEYIALTKAAKEGIWLKGQPKKKKKAKKDLFNIYFNYDGIFTCSPLKYNQGHMKELNDTNFHDMSYEHLKEIALKLVPHGCFEKLYCCQNGVKLNLGLRELRSNQEIGDILKVGYENGNAIDMYVEHFGYDIMGMAEVDRSEEQNQNSIESSDDDYNSSDCEEIENVEFQTEGNESVVIKDISTSDPFLNKLCSARITFRGTIEHIQTETHQIDVVNKVKSGVHYLAFDPDILWDKMQPTLGMRYETPQQLKLALANYSVANGYQLWYMKNDWRYVLVYCGRNVEEGRRAGKQGNKDRVMPNKVRSGVKKKVVKKQTAKKKVVKKQTVKKTTVLDSGKGTNPFMSLRKIRDDIRQKFMIDVSLGQCTRAKQLALFDNEGGLIEHYGKLYQYRQALLESNLRSTCRLDVDESANGSATFRRICICFKRVKDVWLAGCRKVIGLDGCFLKHTCKGELLTTMGRDANNQMYPIAWVVVRVENADN